MKLRSAAPAIALCLAAVTPATAVQVHSSLGDATRYPGKVGEIMLVWDVSAYLWFYLDALAKQADDIVRRVAERFPDGARIGLGSYNEKQKETDPDPYIHCYKTEVPLTTNYSAVAEKVRTLKSHGGEGNYNSQYDALYFAAKSPKVGWSEGLTDSKGRFVVRVVLMFTATHHYWGKQDGMPAFEDHGEEQCGKYSYPDLDILSPVYRDANMNMAFIVSPYRDLKINENYWKTRTVGSKTWTDSAGKGFRAAPVVKLESTGEIADIIERTVAKQMTQLEKHSFFPVDPTNVELQNLVTST